MPLTEAYQDKTCIRADQAAVFPSVFVLGPPPVAGPNIHGQPADGSDLKTIRDGLSSSRNGISWLDVGRGHILLDQLWGKPKKKRTASIRGASSHRRAIERPVVPKVARSRPKTNYISRRPEGPNFTSGEITARGHARFTCASKNLEARQVENSFVDTSGGRPLGSRPRKKTKQCVGHHRRIRAWKVLMEADRVRGQTRAAAGIFSGGIFDLPQGQTPGQRGRQLSLLFGIQLARKADRDLELGFGQKNRRVVLGPDRRRFTPRGKYRSISRRGGSIQAKPQADRAGNSWSRILEKGTGIAWTSKGRTKFATDLAASSQLPGSTDPKIRKFAVAACGKPHGNSLWQKHPNQGRKIIHVIRQPISIGIAVSAQGDWRPVGGPIFAQRIRTSVANRSRRAERRKANCAQYGDEPGSSSEEIGTVPWGAFARIG